jgi:hypothetical protein
MEPAMDRKRVRELNDAFRQSLIGGHVLVTASLANHPRLGELLHAVRTFSDFGEHNDPHHEHDFGALDFHELGKVFFKIDYLDILDNNLASLDPANPSLTRRSLVIMRADEY